MSEHAGTPDEVLASLYAGMVAEYAGGLSNTSTKKFNPLRDYLAGLLSLGPADIYITGAGTRPGNLEVRLSQGIRAMQHTKLGVGYLSAKNLKEATRSVESAQVTIEKFLGRGKASYDAIALMVAIDKKPQVFSVLQTKGSDLGERLKKHFPNIKIVPVKDSPGAPKQPGRQEPPEPGPTPTSAVEFATRFSESVRRAGYVSSGSLPERLLLSLLTKRLAILSGLSGSGKTLLAVALARWLCPSGLSPRNFAVVPVGPDWNNRDPLLGFRDALDPTSYHRTVVVDLLIEAARQPELPYFLILDEMNLAHVERYFADFLSVMESGQPLVFHNSTAEIDGVPAQLESLPPNLFVLGTVNIDETTYVFSPKVLDRANVLEHTVDSEDVRSFLEGASNDIDWTQVDSLGATHAPEFCRLARTEASPTPAASAVIADELALFAPPFQGAGFGVGFRTAAEIARFTALACAGGDDEARLREVFDWQLCQKLLPRLHGSRSKLEPLLRKCRALTGEAHAWNLTEADGLQNSSELEKAAEKAADPLAEYESPDEPMFPLAAEKIARMLVLAERDGFTSFSEG